MDEGLGTGTERIRVVRVSRGVWPNKCDVCYMNDRRGKSVEIAFSVAFPAFAVILRHYRQTHKLVAVWP